MNLLLAEDDAVARLTLSAVLKGLGYEVTEAEHGGEAWARLKAAERILGLRTHVQHLEGLLPICAYCKRIRDASDTWESIERYVEDRSEAQFSHGYCPECYERHVRPQIEGR